MNRALRPASRPSRVARSVGEDAAADLLPLLEFSTIVNSSLDLEFILNTVLRTLMGKLLVARGVLLLRQADNALEVIAAKGVDASILKRTIDVPRIPRVLRMRADLERNAHPLTPFLREHDLHAVIPILSQHQTVGCVLLGDRPNRAGYSAVEKRLVQSVVNLSGSAIEKGVIIAQVRDANRNLDRKIQELNTLFDLGKEFNIGLDMERVVKLISFALMGQVGVKSYAICLKDETSMRLAASRLVDAESVNGLLKELCAVERAARVHDLLRHRTLRFAAANLLQSGIQVVVPMQLQNTTKGLLMVGERMRGGAYTHADLEFLSSLGNLAIIAIENARLFRAELEKQHLEDELKIAREIQQGLLPECLPEIPGFDIAAVNVSSKTVGGDYYDLIRRTPMEYVVAIGDVSGKGSPAALLMSNVQAALRALAPESRTLSETTGRINDLTCANTKGAGKFITFFWGILDVATATLRYVNAGHNPPMLRRADGSIERLEEGGMILGVFPTHQPYAEASVILRPGDLLVLFTDGVSEAMNPRSEELTEERLEEIVRDCGSDDAATVIARIQDAVQQHIEGAPQSDDITLVVLRAVPR